MVLRLGILLGGPDMMPLGNFEPEREGDDDISIISSCLVGAGLGDDAVKHISGLEAVMSQS
jgi:hypothetical protein